ncbi:MAG: acyl--CoA ligase [Lachnospiraceae bacterium]|nr:acyl--CoA ligase [Lachnospiraceae bacterium]
MLNASIIIQKPIHTPDMDLYQFLLHRPKINASPILCRCRSQELSFSRLQQDSASYAVALASVGVKKGDIVPICSEPSIEAIIMFFALNRLGAVTTFLNNTASIQEINRYMEDFSASILVGSKNLIKRADYLTIKADKMVVLDSEKEILTKDVPAISLSKLIRESADSSVILDIGGKKDYAHISYTSGSTGAPKAIMMTNENIIAAIISLKKATMLRIGPKKESLQIVPFNYPYGLIVSVLLHMYCGTIVALSPGLTLKNISEFFKIYRPCYINGIPSFYTAMVQDPEIQTMDLSCIRFPITGGDTLDAKTEQRINAFLHEHGSKGVISNGYGNGEGGGCILNPTAVLRKCASGSCGRPIPGLSVKLIDDKTGNPVPIGEIGRLCFSGTNLMVGYYQNGRVASDMFVTDEQGNRWFYTDSYMHMDRRGWMFMDGRERRFFITFDEHGSPYKVYCEHVQKALLENCPELQSCAVVQKANDTRSFIPVCYLCFLDDVDASAWEAIISRLKNSIQKVLPNCAIPKEYHILKELPLSQAGKVDYSALEKLADKCEA